MAKNEKAKPKTNNVQRNVSIAFPDNMSKADMIDVLSSAIYNADEMKAEKEAERQRQEDEAWHKKAGLKDYSDRKWLPRVVLSFFNTIGCFFRILFMPRRKISGNHATNGLMKLSVQIVFRITRIVFWLFAIYAVLCYPTQFVFPIAKQYTLTEYLNVLPFAVLSIVFAQLFRMAEIEIEKMKDKNYIVDIFAAVMAVVAIIVSLL